MYLSVKGAAKFGSREKEAKAFRTTSTSAMPIMVILVDGERRREGVFCEMRREMGLTRGEVMLEVNDAKSVVPICTTASNIYRSPANTFNFVA